MKQSDLNFMSNNNMRKKQKQVETLKGTNYENVDGKQKHTTLRIMGLKKQFQHPSYSNENIPVVQSNKQLGRPSFTKLLQSFNQSLPQTQQKTYLFSSNIKQNVNSDKINWQLLNTQKLQKVLSQQLIQQQYQNSLVQYLDEQNHSYKNIKYFNF